MLARQLLDIIQPEHLAEEEAGRRPRRLAPGALARAGDEGEVGAVVVRGKGRVVPGVCLWQPALGPEVEGIVEVSWVSHVCEESAADGNLFRYLELDILVLMNGLKLLYPWSRVHIRLFSTR